MEYKIKLKPVILQADSKEEAEEIFSKLKWDATVEEVVENGS